MSLTKWIREHRRELDQHIQWVAPGAPQNDRERELWVRNDETLYHWAKAEGVRV